jgi:hypothetical protein
MGKEKIDGMKAGKLFGGPRFLFKLKHNILNIFRPLPVFF